jgi:hypothetical protein
LPRLAACTATCCRQLLRLPTPLYTRSIAPAAGMARLLHFAASGREACCDQQMIAKSCTYTSRQCTAFFSALRTRIGWFKSVCARPGSRLPRCKADQSANVLEATDVQMEFLANHVPVMFAGVNVVFLAAAPCSHPGCSLHMHTQTM